MKKSCLKKKRNYSFDVYYVQKKINNLCELILLISISLAEAEEGIRYYFKHTQESNKEIALYRALECAEWMEEKQVWLDFYRYGLTQKIKPRDSLREKYEKILQENEKNGKSC